MPTAKAPTKVIYARDLSKHMTAAVLRKPFEDNTYVKQYGQVISSRVCVTQGAPRTFGWVTITANVANTALAELNGTLLLGRPLILAPATTLKTGAMDMTFWMSDAAKALIVGGNSTVVTGLGRFLRSFNPTADLMVDSSGADIWIYAQNVLTGPTTPVRVFKKYFLNALLNVYFSSPGVAALKTIPVPLGNVTLPLQRLVTTSGTFTARNLSTMFSNSTTGSATIIEILTSVARHSDVGGNTLYGNFTGNEISANIANATAVLAMVSTDTVLLTLQDAGTPPATK